MDAHEDLPELVGELGEALVRSLTEDPECRALAQRVRALGFNITLSLEASPMGSPVEEDPAWSEEDKRMMKFFRISLD
ncbi:MAG: hypothetical protein HYZ13_01015 [Acidobacteria bacterium]|nr:hypothetical protein [Acidobacteriota bacterium]